MAKYDSDSEWEGHPLLKRVQEAEKRARDAEALVVYWREVAEHDTSVASAIRMRNRDLEERNRVLELGALEIKYKTA